MIVSSVVLSTSISLSLSFMLLFIQRGHNEERFYN